MLTRSQLWIAKINTHYDARITWVCALSLFSCVQVLHNTLISQGDCMVLEIKSENLLKYVQRCVEINTKLTHSLPMRQLRSFGKQLEFQHLDL